MDFKLLIITETTNTSSSVVANFETSFAADSAASKLAETNTGYRITVIKLY